MSETVKCKGCRRELKKDEIRTVEAYSKRLRKPHTMRVCKYCGAVIK